MSEKQTTAAQEVTIRDYFAGQAIIALMSNDRWVVGLDLECYRDGSNFKRSLVDNAYAVADAFLAARQETSTDA